jgi:hypothetical protein
MTGKIHCGSYPVPTLLIVKLLQPLNQYTAGKRNRDNHNEKNRISYMEKAIARNIQTDVLRKAFSQGYK